MRLAGTIQSADQANRFGDYLLAQGIRCSVDAGASGYAVWVHEEDQVGRAREEIARFQSEPDHERYRNVQQQANTIRREQGQRAKSGRAQTVYLRDRWSRPTIDQGPATFGLLALMMIVGVMTGLHPEKHPQFLMKMLISTDGTFSEVLSGEFWRLIAPIFLHFGILHFVFDLIALRDFGLLIELRVGTARFLILVLVIALVSNVAQFLFAGPMFGGMSGVIYGLFGYAWVRGRLEPEWGLWLSPRMVTYMLGWLVICLFLPQIANWAHGAGLAAGAAMAAIPVMFKSLFKS